MIISVPALKAGGGNEPEMAYNNTFIDEHFVQDSVLVLINGAVISAVLEAFCRRGVEAFPVDHQAFFCQFFAPEATTFLYLAKSQWPKDALETWSYLNMVLFGGTMAMTSIEQRLCRYPLVPVQRAVISMVYYQAIRVQAETVTRYVTGSNQSFSPIYMMFNSVSTGLMTGGLSLWLTYIQIREYKPLILMVTPGVTLMSLFFYYFGSSEIIDVELIETVVVDGTAAVAAAVAIVGITIGARARARARAGAGAAAGFGVAVGTVFGATFGVAAGAIAIARAEVETGVGVEAALAEAVVVVTVVLAGAGAGVFIVVITGFTIATLSRYSGAFPIVSRGIFMTIVTGLPLMVCSWGVSWERFVESNVTAHETMQNEFMFSLNKLGAFFSDSWIHKLFYWE